MSRFGKSVIGIPLVVLGTALLEIAGTPLSGLSLMDAAHAAPRAAHRSAHRTARPGRRHTDVDVDWRPAVGAVAAGIALGTRVATLPRGCTTVVTTDDVTYHHCDGVYYRPYYEGTKVVYAVVDEP